MIFVKLKLDQHILNNIIKNLQRNTSLFFFDKEKPSGLHGPIKHILFINWNGMIGDAIVSSFLFRELRKIKDITLSVITTESLKPLYLNDYKVDNVFIVKNNSYIELFLVSVETHALGHPNA